MINASLIASLSAPPSPSGAELASLPGEVDWLEVRADLTGEIPAEWLRSHFKGRLLYSLRSVAEGGNSDESVPERRERLEVAARGYDRMELEAERDLTSGLLDKLPAEKRCVAWHGRGGSLSELETRFRRLASFPAAIYKLQVKTDKVADEIAPLLLLKGLGRDDTIAFADGPLGYWNRLAALQLGSPAIYGLVSRGLESAAEPTIERLIDDYGLPQLQSISKLFAIIGDPIFHSLSPRLHNASYRAMNYPGLFVPLHVTDFEEFWREIVCTKVLDSLGLPLQGMTVASPHKEAALRAAKLLSPMTQQAESANILVRNNGWWQADTTDPQVVYMASEERSIQLKDKRAAVIGCGGAGRAIAAALVHSGAGVTLVNRGAERGQHAADLLGLPYLPLLDFSADGYDILVNATPVGRDTDEAPFNVDHLGDDVLVIDLVYGSRPTPLVEGTRARAQSVIDGRDVLVTQVLQQFRLMTGQEMPSMLALETLGRQATQNLHANQQAPKVINQ